MKKQLHFLGSTLVVVDLDWTQSTTGQEESKTFGKEKVKAAISSILLC